MRLTGLLLLIILNYPLTAKPLTIESIWATGPDSIKGTDSVQTGNFIQFPEYECKLSVQNDSNNLYLCFRSTDKVINRQIMMTGFAVTFNGNQKGKDVILGIQYPTGMRSLNRPRTENGTKPDPEMFKALEEQMLQSLAITGPGKNDSRPMGVGIADSFGIKVKCTNQKGTLTYELIVPLKKGTPLTGEIDLIKKSSVKVSFETTPPDFDSEKSHEGGHSGRHGSGMAGESNRGDGMGGIMGGSQSENSPGGRGPGRKRMEPFDPFKSTVIINLSSFIPGK